jgi:hypothetical protein
MTSALVAGEWAASSSSRFTLRENAPGTFLIGGWVDPSTGLDYVEDEILAPTGHELQSLGRQERSQSLYLLVVPAHRLEKWMTTV